MSQKSNFTLKHLVTCLCLLPLSLLSLQGQQQANTVPNQMNYQGTLLDSNGTLLSTGQYVLTFRIYSSLNGTADDLLWGPQTFKDNNEVTIVDGQFNVILGPNDDITDDPATTTVTETARSLYEALGGTSGSAFLEITVGNETVNTPISPRQQILVTPYALHAENANFVLLDGVNSVAIIDETIASVDILDETITSDDIQDETITSDDIQDETITSDDIQDETIVGADIGIGAVGSDEIATGAVGSNKIADGSIESVDIKDGSITSADLAALAGINFSNSRSSHMDLDGAFYRWPATASNAYLTVDDLFYIRDSGGDSKFTFNTNTGEVTATKFTGDGSGLTNLSGIDASAIATGAVGSDEIATGAVGSNKIADGSITSADLAALEDIQFATNTKQKLNLYNLDYAIGVQSNTQYYRSGRDFAWYEGGTHSNVAQDPGSGGTTLMTLDGSTGILEVNGSISSQNPGTSPIGSGIGLGSPAGDIGITIQHRADSDKQRWDVKVARSDKSFRITDNTNNNTDCLTITENSNNIGIGTTTPSEKLEVNGTVKATSFSGDGSQLTGVVASSIADGTITSADFATGFIDNDLLITDTFNINDTAEPELDQSNTAGNLNSWSSGFSQSFTAGKTGYLVQVDLSTGSPRSDNSPSSGTIRIYQGEGTSGALLATVNTTFTDPIRFQSHSLSAPFPKVTSGQKYTIQVSISGEPGDYWVSFHSANPYGGGSGGSDVDYLFKTYVATSLIVLNDGNVGIGTTTPSAKLEVNGTVKASGIRFDSPVSSDIETDGAIYRLSDGQFYLTVDDNFYIRDKDNGNRFHFNTDNGVASKSSGGGDWSSLSDQRVKKDIRDFTNGLETIRQINPVFYKYNGKAGYPDDGQEHVGVIAQDAQPHAPYMFEIVPKKLNEDDAEETDLLMYDSTALTYILVNAVKEQQAIIEALRSERETTRRQLEGILARLEQLEMQN